ncbi:hypothetical protein [Mycobacteroides abscessus]|uniref:hypothetical protein n=1 Tax=Mycobacteroides abscessus TaxID=36809 RepID=UPI00092AD7FA|nr:hypothetical protein [Mycobacteroides abscessus]MDM2088223.1 hypothetical protein [Mycobacteroides abscessus]MDO3096256.1 hypothetical protein [Mycobacteroides abscessus subsp. abscessus]SHQ07113.1 Uncharacterised protein [Mycobacteroides abscessus subsp. abscessus]SHQ54357.1 Uncharacterised protein [Mycobacteroides abscessus subsp. abscessus]SHQ56799.1 Uncharacterised protein [Mycobacteroides abscessus subsp. abscessus]
MANGLDSLTAMRESKRRVPPPRHQPRQTPVDMPAATPAASATTAPASPAAPAAVAAPAVPKSSRPAVTTAPATTELTKVSIYLDDPTDTYLETVRGAARTARPRVDATRSAVVRLALNRLAEQLDPASVVAELQRKAAGHSGPGRKRA